MPTITGNQNVRERLESVRSEIDDIRGERARLRQRKEQKLAEVPGDLAADAFIAHPAFQAAEQVNGELEDVEDRLARAQQQELALLHSLGEAPARQRGNGPSDADITARPGEPGEWMSRAIQASLTTAEVGSDQDIDVIFHELVTPASAFLASRPTVEDISTTSARVTVVNGRLTAASIIPEGQAITPEDPPFERPEVTPNKYGKLVELSLEALRDSTPSRLAIAEGAMVEAIGSGIDLQFFHGAGPEQVGLVNTSGVRTVDAGGSLTNLDPFVEGIQALRRGQLRATAIYMSPVTWERLGKIKKADNSNEPLVSAGFKTATGEPDEEILGVPVYQSDQIQEDVAFVARTRELLVVRRSDVEVKVDEDYDFGSAGAAMRVLTRLILEVGDPTAVCVIENLPISSS